MINISASSEQYCKKLKLILVLNQTTLMAINVFPHNDHKVFNLDYIHHLFQLRGTWVVHTPILRLPTGVSIVGSANMYTTHAYIWYRVLHWGSLYMIYVSSMYIREVLCMSFSTI